MVLTSCPDAHDLQFLLHGGGAQTDRDDLVLHLETCSDCQSTLESLAAEPVVWARAAGGLDDAAWQEPALHQVLERLKEEEPTTVGIEDLGFLQPTDKPGLLGLLGPYEVVREIGRGGMGVVLEARDPSLQRVVAIKVLSPCLAWSQRARRRFVREARSAAAVNHAHIVTVYGVEECDGLPCLIMQHVAGESLQARLDHVGPLSVEEVVQIGLETAAGLAAAHAQGLIHRDIKPANILIADCGSQIADSSDQSAIRNPQSAIVKITDFGLARMVDDVGLTQNGVVAGTPEYMAPEQARGERVDHRADLFSLGSVMYAACTGKPPFSGSSTVAVLRHVCDDEPAPIHSLNSAVPAWLETLIGKLMAKNPADRIQSAVEVVTLLDGFCAHLQKPEKVEPPNLPSMPGQSRQEQSRSRLLSTWKYRAWLATFVLLAVAGLITGFLLLRKDGPTKQAGQADKDQTGRKRVEFDLRSRLESFPALQLHKEGADPDDEVLSLARTDSEGLRVTFPEGRQDTRPVALEFAQRLRGDFDIVVSYELIAVGKPVPEYGAGVILKAFFDSPSPFHVVLGRSRRQFGESFGAHRVVNGPDGKNQYLDNKHLKATQMKGKLRLQRTDKQLHYLVAEGAEFKKIQSVEIGTADVKSVQAHCHTMFKPISLDVRLSELVVEADEFPDGVPASSVQPKSAEAQQIPDAKWQSAVIALAVLTVLLAGATGLWLYARQRGKSSKPAGQAAPKGGESPDGNATPAAIVVRCPQCERASKARAEWAGKRIKCPQCGNVLTVPVRSEGT
jgi:serine/threonine protein kinase